MIKSKYVTTLPDEEWRDVVGFEGYYQVSNLGRVLSCDRIVYKNGGSFIQKGRILSTPPDTHGYAKLIFSVDKEITHDSVHRVVAKAFILNPETKPHVNHLNSIRHDNRVENLEWATEKENSMHAAAKGRIGAKGSRNSYAKVDEALVLEIREKYATRNYYLSELSKEYNIHFGTISYIVRGDTWKHVGGPICRENRGKETKRYQK